MLLILACCLAAAAAAPATYDQRQDGEFNVQADVQNIVLLVAIPQKVPMDLIGQLIDFKSNSREAQDRADVPVMTFGKESTPYRVEIGTKGSERSVEEEEVAEVVISGRRRSDTEQPDHDVHEYKLIGAMEQCGPERERDPVTLTCRPISKIVPVETPEVVPASS